MAWAADQQQQHLGSDSKCKFSGPTSGLGSATLGTGPPKPAILRLLSSSLRTLTSRRRPEGRAGQSRGGAKLSKHFSGSAGPRAALREHTCAGWEHAREPQERRQEGGRLRHPPLPSPRQLRPSGTRPRRPRSVTALPSPRTGLSHLQGDTPRARGLSQAGVAGTTLCHGPCR